MGAAVTGRICSVRDANRSAQLSAQTPQPCTRREEQGLADGVRDEGTFVFTNLPESRAESQRGGCQEVLALG